MKGAGGFCWALLLVLYSFIEAAIRYFCPRKKKDISGRTVLITGGGGGLGKQLAIQFAENGARVVLWDIDLESAERTASIVNSMDADALAYYCDCSKEEQVKEVARQVVEEIGEIDILVNNAGILNGRSIVMLTEKEIRKSIEINLLAHFWTIKAFLPSMLDKNEGHIVTISSSAGLHGSSYLTDYCAAKFGTVGLQESLSLELREQGFNGIRFTCVCPNFINTGMSWYPKTNVPWLIPILNVEDVARQIVEAVQADEEMLILPPGLARLLNTRCLIPQRGSLAIYDWTGIGIDPHVPSSRKRIEQKYFKP